MKCKFCGCTDEHACQVPVVLNPEGPMVWAGDPAKADGFMPCEWIIPEVCSNPECVKKAYDEAREIVDSLIVRPSVQELYQLGMDAVAQGLI